LIQIKRSLHAIVHVAKEMGRAIMLANYSVRERLRDGRGIEIRVLRPEDQPAMLAAVDHASTQSLRRRFFATKRGFSEQEKAFFMKIDLVNHVALVAVIEEDGKPVIIGGGRYVVTEGDKAEVAFLVIDAYQGQGIGAILTRHLAVLARAAGVKELVADVLPENAAMLKVLNRLGFRAGRRLDPQVVQLTMRLT
jgi:RimJ/RimL family protein N-acetyltransferase